TCPHHTGNLGPGHRATTHHARLARRIQGRAVPSRLTVAGHVVVNRHDLTVENRVFRTSVHALREHVTGLMVYDHRTERVRRIAAGHIDRQSHELFMCVQVLDAGCG